MQQLIPAASALIIHKGKVLFLRSDTTQEQWAFPGGKQEKKETPQQTVSREIKEELGIDIEIKRKLGSFKYISGNRKFEIKCFVAETRSFDLKVNPDEIIEVKWCALKESADLNLTSTTREALQKFTW
ncbi:NUDIX hydrolase [Chloroflexota bacterium]